MDITGITIEDLERELRRRKTSQVSLLRQEIARHLVAIRALEQEADAILTKPIGTFKPAIAHVGTGKVQAIATRLHEAMKELGHEAKPEALVARSGLSSQEYRAAVNYLVSSGRAKRLGHARGTSYLAI